MTLYLLDTNIAAHLMRGDSPEIARRVENAAAGDELAVSVISQAELLYGWAKRGKPDRLGRLIGAFIARVDVLPWTQAAAHAYAELRIAIEAAGIPLSISDMLIAAHAKAAGAVLASRDKAFQRIAAEVPVEDWR